MSSAQTIGSANMAFGRFRQAPDETRQQNHLLKWPTDVSGLSICFPVNPRLRNTHNMLAYLIDFGHLKIHFRSSLASPQEDFSAFPNRELQIT